MRHVRENGARNVGCIIQDVNNGNILAMASYPNFDLNDPKNIDNLIGTNLVDEKGNVLSDVITEEVANKIIEEPELGCNIATNCWFDRWR